MAALAGHHSVKREESLRRWLFHYAALRGLDAQKITEIVRAVLDWGCCADPDRDLTTIKDLGKAHEELEAACAGACAIGTSDRPRRFMVLASKALWLRYPNEAPIYDDFAGRALMLVSKLESDLGIPLNKNKYQSYAYAWRTLYDRHREVLEEIRLDPDLYRGRVLDKILWQLGQPVF